MNVERLDEVEVGASLGAGSCGEVFEVAGSGESLVVKRLHALAIDRDFLRRHFTRLAAMPPVPGIPRVFAARLDRAPYAILIERVAGAPLERFGGMKEASAWKVIRQLADILGHAHKHGVCHGHLHPGNVLLTGEGKEAAPIVLDFGSGLVGAVHHIDLGDSAAFAAPEQLLAGGRGWEDGRIQKWDVYSFGLLAYWLIHDRLPRGAAFMKERKHLLAKSGGRPVPFDLREWIETLHAAPAVEWSHSFGAGREARDCRGIIDRCLALDPAERPVDLREVRNQFRALDHRFALEDAEERVVKERRKQKAKLFGARTVAACLGLSFLGATYYLVEYFRKTYFFRNKVSELDQVVVTQRATIHHLDERWADTVSDLKRSREAADSFFQRMAGGESAGGGTPVAKEELEKSRAYYLKTLEDVSGEESQPIERGRALHSLAHIERKLGLGERAADHFRGTVSEFKGVLASGGLAHEALVDVHARLADSHEHLAALEDNPVGAAALSSLESAVLHFDEVARLKPRDAGNAIRLAGTAFLLGSAYEAHRRHEEAVSAYARSAELAEALRNEAAAGNGDAMRMTELVGKLQFQTAKSLRHAGRPEESIHAHVAAMETLETLRGVNGFSPVQSLQLAEGYLELGELFAGRGATPDELDQLHNETLRLLTPLNTADPADVEVAALLCRSLIHLAVLERDEARWSAGYRLAVRGIEALQTALESEPGHAPGHLALAEARLEHLGFFSGDRDASLKVAVKGVETAETVARLLAGDSIEEPLRTRLRARLEAVFSAYAAQGEVLGEAALVERCRNRAVVEVTNLGEESP
jgi:tetratricopeptide (TPR) repeat protein